jgi:hypothetical protein
MGLLVRMTAAFVTPHYSTGMTLSYKMRRRRPDVHCQDQSGAVGRA